MYAPQRGFHFQRDLQTGLGRTRWLLAEEHEGIEADLTLIGKALSGGFYPVSAVLSNDEILGVLKPGEHGSTFGGNPLACAVARAALKVLIEEGMIENASVMGARFLAGLRRINSPAVKEVRGRGLMIAVELHPHAGGARHYCDALRRARHPMQGYPRPHYPSSLLGDLPRRDTGRSNNSTRAWRIRKRHSASRSAIAPGELLPRWLPQS